MFENALKYCKEKAIDLLTGFVPKTYSMTEECNILGFMMILSSSLNKKI